MDLNEFLFVNLKNIILNCFINKPVISQEFLNEFLIGLKYILAHIHIDVEKMFLLGYQITPENISNELQIFFKRNKDWALEMISEIKKEIEGFTYEHSKRFIEDLKIENGNIFEGIKRAIYKPLTE